MLVTIIIINYNSRSVLLDCLRSLTNCNISFKTEIFIIDNASTESIKDLEQEFPNFHFIFNERNIGFAGANNIGIRKAQGQYILLLNPDTIVNSGFLEPLIRYLDSHPSVGIVGPKIFNAHGEIEHSTHSFPSIIKEFFHANEGLKRFFHYQSPLMRIVSRFAGKGAAASYWAHDEERVVDHVTGACMLVKKEVIDQAGLLDEAFFLYNEEVEWSLRIKKAGFDSVFLPESNIIHLFGHSTQQKVQKQKVNHLLVERYRGMFYLFKKHFSVLHLIILRLIVLQGFCCRLLSLLFRQFTSSRLPVEEFYKVRKYLVQIIFLAFKANFDWRTGS